MLLANIRIYFSFVVDAPNDSDEYTFSVRRLPEGSVFTLGDEFKVELFYNNDLKVTLNVPVVKANAVVYQAFTVVPTKGIYEVLNEFD